MLKVREFLPDEWQTYRALRLRSLAESPDAFGSTLAAASLKAHLTGDQQKNRARETTDRPECL